MLITLSYRLPRARAAEILGTITAYPLTAEFSDAWSKLPKGKSGKQPRYSSLATGLCAATAQPVRLFGERDLTEGEVDAGSRMLLLTSRPFDYRLPVAVTTWEHQIRGDQAPETLTPLLPEPEPEPARPLADYITFRPNASPEAPNWVYRTAAWQLTAHLARQPLRIDGRPPLTLRMDTDGSLLAWEVDDLITSPDGTAFGMARIAARLVTSPGTGDLIVCFSAHLSRIAPKWAAVKRAWIARDDPGALLLRLPVHHRRRPRDDPRTEADPWQHDLSREVLAIIEACELEPITLPDSLPPVPGGIRPLASGYRHPLGTGLGARFMLRLHEHVTACLPTLEPLGLEPDKAITLAKRDPAPALTDAAVGSAGYQRLTIACLYATAGARDRMLGTLQELTGEPLTSLPDGQPRPVSGRLSVIAFRCPQMLAHGEPNRAAHLARLLTTPELSRDHDNLTCAWVETEFHPEMSIDRTADAKPHLRRLLALSGIPSQFLATEPLTLPKGARRRTESATAHAARSALHDLLRIAGILDDRIPQAVTSPRHHRLDRPVLLVGIHARRQQTGDSEDPPLVLVLAAIRATPDPDVPWQSLLYSGKQRRWVRHAAGIADFHSRAIGDPALGRTEEKAARTRDLVEKHLAQLAAGHPGLPMAIFTDAPATRTIWPGLQDRHFGAGPMPGDTLRAAGTEVAVVRSNHNDEIGRPVTRHGEGIMPGDPFQPAAPGRRVYRCTDTAQSVWLFAGISRTYGAKGGSIGAQYTRWTLPAGLSGMVRKPWHSYTGTEISVPSPGMWDPAALAALTARLCEQPVSWDGRIVYATPLHLAASADRDHPDYRAATPQETDDDADDASPADEDAEDPWEDGPEQEAPEPDR